ncbi:hypothetical protein FQN54_008430 [Arachnomyces sp. PD_36]|nr:hypothetical protein FQN54_008430 [Arachnomyces sp. PD_36]
MTTRYAESHRNPQGPGDARPTARQIIADEGLEDGWGDKVVFITGASSGLGVETAKALSTTGAHLYLAARDLDKTRTALGELSGSPRVHLLQLDLASFASVRACATEFLSKNKTLNIFIANAGVMATPESRTEDGFETQFGTNHLGHFLLFNLLKPALLEAATPENNSRALILSSLGHRQGEVNFDNYNLEGAYDPFAAYGQSKTANLWTANEIDRRYSSQGLRAFSIQPGWIRTGIVQHLPEEVVSSLSSDPALPPQFKTPEQGAATTVWGATSKSLDGMGGKYLENSQIAIEWDSNDGPHGTGYAPHAYSPEKEKKLWELSLRLVGLGDES